MPGNSPDLGLRLVCAPDMGSAGAGGSPVPRVLLAVRLSPQTTEQPHGGTRGARGGAVPRADIPGLVLEAQERCGSIRDP